MTNLPIHITTHHLSASNALHRFAREKISSVCRFANDALAADVVLRRHGGTSERFSASARLALPGRDIHGRAVAGNLYAAIRKLVAKLARLSRKRKTRLAKTFEHPGQSETSADLAVPPHAQEALPEPSEALEQPHAREGTVADVTNQKPNVVPTNQKGERESTVTSQFDDVKATAEKHLRVMPARSNLAVRFVPIGVIPIADLHRSSEEAYLMSSQ